MSADSLTLIQLRRLHRLFVGPRMAASAANSLSRVQMTGIVLSELSLMLTHVKG